MATSTQIAEVLNDLILINNDRIEGYEKALRELDTMDIELGAIFRRFIVQSENLRTTLQDEVKMLGEDIETGTTTSGKIYRAWMDVKATFSGNDRQTALNNCEFGEDAAQRAYESAEQTEELPTSIINLIREQKTELKTAHDHIKALRDQNI